ncbi:prenyltransferase [Saccharopolyspora sp. MS10]|uniref:prenyltransferase n=1 Tax=Saccharopolyspora sp. MS10 TaxID=3385973 RepID=UPI0039A1C922
MPELPEVDGVLSRAAVLETARSIAAEQEASGAVPWFAGGHVDPWDHVESAMALSAAGLLPAAERAYEWLRRGQRADGSWPMQFRDGVVEDAGADTNFCAYPAVGVWHHYLITGDAGFAERMWPVVRRAVDFVLGLQRPRGEVVWARGAGGEAAEEALLAGSSSIHHSLVCALELAEHLGVAQPDWEVALGRLAHALRHHPEAFAEKDRYAMDWYYPVLGGPLRDEAGRERILRRWADFFVDGLGSRCVDDHPWVTGAETCELALSLDLLGLRDRAEEALASIQHLREEDGSYWTGLVYTDGKRWPVERTTWTGAAVVLAADSLSGATPGSGIFRVARPSSGLAVDHTCGCSPSLTGPARD